MYGSVHSEVWLEDAKDLPTGRIKNTQDKIHGICNSTSRSEIRDKFHEL